jgi:hypothetical protein
MKEWIVNNQALVIAIGTLLVTVISTIVARTANTTDNKVWEIVRSLAAQIGWLDKDGKFSMPFVQGPVTDALMGKDSK